MEVALHGAAGCAVAGVELACIFPAVADFLGIGRQGHRPPTLFRDAAGVVEVEAQDGVAEHEVTELGSVGRIEHLDPAIALEHEQLAIGQFQLGRALPGFIAVVGPEALLAVEGLLDERGDGFAAAGAQVHAILAHGDRGRPAVIAGPGDVVGLAVGAQHHEVFGGQAGGGLEELPLVIPALHRAAGLVQTVPIDRVLPGLLRLGAQQLAQQLAGGIVRGERHWAVVCQGVFDGDAAWVAVDDRTGCRRMRGLASGQRRRHNDADHHRSRRTAICTHRLSFP